MNLFSSLRAVFERRRVDRLEAFIRCAASESAQRIPQGSFVFPGTDYLDDIEVLGQRVGNVDYGINPLGDRLYINMLEIIPTQRRQGIGLAVLWQLWRTHQVPIVPLDQRTSSDGFRYRARRRFTAAGAVLGEELRGEEHRELEQQRWVLALIEN